MSELLLALRNLLRNRRRSLSTLLTLALGLTSILLFGGFKTNIKYSMLTAYVRAGGHLQIQHEDFFAFGSGNPTAYAIVKYEEIIKLISSDKILQKLITVVTPTLRIGGIASHVDAGVSRTVIGNGYVAADINAMRLWNEMAVPIIHPRFVIDGAARDSAIVGVGVARVLQLCAPLGIQGCKTPESSKAEEPATGPDLPADITALANAQAPHTAGTSGTGTGTGTGTGPGNARTFGARIELLASSGRGAPNVAALNVLAAEDQGFKELDEIAVIMHLDFAQQLVFGRQPGKVTGIMVQLLRTEDQAYVAERIRALLKGFTSQPLAVRTVEELNPFYVQSLQLFDVIFGFISVLIGGIVLFTVGNTMNAAVVERTVEIGTLRAIGLRQSGVRRIFIFEGALLGAAGAILGVLLALFTAWMVNRSGLTWLPPGSSEWLPLQLRVAGEHSAIFGAAFGLLFAATISAWLPAWNAARLNVVEALRHA